MNKKIIILIVVVVLGAAGGIGYLAAQHQKAAAVVSKSDITTDTNTQGATESDLTLTLDGVTYNYNPKIKTYLFLGVDKDGETEVQGTAGRAGQSDCMILFVLDTENETTTMLEIPRDSMVDLDVYDISGKFLANEHAQLALQYAYGDGEKKSCWLTKKKTLEMFNDQIRIDGYISLNMKGIPILNDFIGGVNITVPEDYTSIDPAFTKGAQLTLNGTQADAYIRSRDLNVTGSNLQRMERQTQYLNALFAQMKGKLDSDTIQKLMDAASPYLVTDMDVDTMKQIGQYTLNEETYTVPGTVTAGAEHDEYNVNNDELTKIIAEMFYKMKNK